MMAEIMFLFPEYSCLRTDIQRSALDVHRDDEDVETSQTYFQNALQHFRELSLIDSDGDAVFSSSSSYSYSPSHSLKPTIAKYLNVLPENVDRLTKEFEDKKRTIEDASHERTSTHNITQNKHFNLRPSTCKNLLEPIHFLDELENESSKKGANVTPSPLKKLPPTSNRPPFNSNSSTPTSATLNKNKINPSAIKKVGTSNLPSTPKTAMLKTPIGTPTTQLLSHPPTSSPAAPRSVFLDDTIALQRMKEQQQNEKKRTSSKQLTDEQKQREKERKKVEKQELKEKKEKEKLEKKKLKEEQKKRQAEERKAAQQQSGVANGPGRKRRKNNPANQQGSMDSLPGDGMDVMSGANVPQMHPHHPGANQPQHMYSTTLINPSNPAYYQTGPMFAGGAGANTGFGPFGAPSAGYPNMMNPSFFSPSNQPNQPQPSAQQGGGQLLPNMANPQMNMPGGLPKNVPVDQTSFTQLLGITQNNAARNPQGNLLPQFAPGSAQPNFPPMLFAQGDPSMNMMFSGRQMPPQSQVRQPNPQNGYPQNYPNYMGVDPQAQQPTQQSATPQISEEEKRQRLENLLNTSILKDCNRVTEDTKKKIIQFLSGAYVRGPNTEDKVLIHEEVDNDEKRQIYFHMDHNNRKWKKIMQKQNTQPPRDNLEDALKQE